MPFEQLWATVAMPHKLKKTPNLAAFSLYRDASDCIDKQIQDKLRASFSDVLAEPIPERFLKLLDRLADGKKT